VAAALAYLWLIEPLSICLSTMPHSSSCITWRYCTYLSSRHGRTAAQGPCHRDQSSAAAPTACPNAATQQFPWPRRPSRDHTMPTEARCRCNLRRQGVGHAYSKLLDTECSIMHAQHPGYITSWKQGSPTVTAYLADRLLTARLYPSTLHC